MYFYILFIKCTIDLKIKYDHYEDECTIIMFTNIDLVDNFIIKVYNEDQDYYSSFTDITDKFNRDNKNIKEKNKHKFKFNRDSKNIKEKNKHKFKFNRDNKNINDENKHKNKDEDKNKLKDVNKHKYNLKDEDNKDKNKDNKNKDNLDKNKLKDKYKIEDEDKIKDEDKNKDNKDKNKLNDKYKINDEDKYNSKLIFCASKLPCYKKNTKKIFFTDKKDNIHIIKNIDIKITNVVINDLYFDIIILEGLVRKNIQQNTFLKNTLIYSTIRNLSNMHYEEVIKYEIISDLLNLQNNILLLNKKIEDFLREFIKFKEEYKNKLVEDFNMKNRYQQFYVNFMDYKSINDHYEFMYRKIREDIGNRNNYLVKSKYSERQIK